MTQYATPRKDASGGVGNKDRKSSSYSICSIGSEGGLDAPCQRQGEEPAMSRKHLTEDQIERMIASDPTRRKPQQAS